jgi:exodeoxyribonuclease VII large subunit
MVQGVTSADALTIKAYITLVNEVLADGVGSHWVQGEVSNLRFPPAGHVYLDLVENVNGESSKVALKIWRSNWQRIKPQLAKAGLNLEAGTKISVYGECEVWNVGGSFAVSVSKIDPNFTLGLLAGERDRTIRRLADEGVLGLNKQLTFPLVPLRVALVTSKDSAAHRDAESELLKSGLGFHVSLYHSAVQGAEAVRDLPRIIAEAGRRRDIDVVMVVRGGGAKNDLAAFDDYAVARAICECRVPVVVGIGHEIDSSVADAAANRAYKTPTACAAALVDAVEEFVDETEATWSAIARAARHGIDGESRRLARVSVDIRSEVRSALEASSTRLAVTASRLRLRPSAIIGIAERSMSHRADRLRLLDPRTTMARGWSIVRDASGRTVRSVGQVSAGDAITVQVADGEVAATVGGRRT